MKATFFKKVKKFGNSYILTLDKEIREILELKEGDLVSVDIELLKSEKDEVEDK